MPTLDILLAKENKANVINRERLLLIESLFLHNRDTSNTKFTDMEARIQKSFYRVSRYSYF